MQTAGLGVSVEPGPARANATQLLAGWIGAEAVPLVILLDEAGTIAPEAGRVFFEAVQAATLRDLPFLLIAAGTPDAPRRLRQAGTFTERMFEQVPVGRLERGATVRALCEPAGDTGLPFADDAGSLLAAASQDYPYFIQLLGGAAWDAAHGAGGAGIGVESAREGIASAQLQVERFFAARFAEARERDVEDALVPLAALFAERGGRLPETELNALLRSLVEQRVVPGSRSALLNNVLSDLLGVLWETLPTGWEMGIPSFGDFVLQHHAS